VGHHFDTDSSDSKDMVVWMALHPRTGYFEEISLTVIISLQGSFMRHGLSREQCEAECVVQIIAGSDTTGTTIRTALMFVLGTPRIYNRFMKEARSAMDAGLVPSSTPITYEQGKKLPYLQVCDQQDIRATGENMARSDSCY